MIDPDPSHAGLARSDPWGRLRALTPARIALGRAGGSLTTSAHLDFQLAHALARDAVHDALDLETIGEALGHSGMEWVSVRSSAGERGRYLQRPDLGRRLDPTSHELLERRSSVDNSPDVVFVVADGLSARAVQRHSVPLLDQVRPPLIADGWRLAPIVVAEQGRVALGDEIGAILGARLVVVLIGERPGLSSPDSLSAYLTWQPRIGRTDADRNCVSNIRPEGLAYGPAGERLRYLMSEARRRRMSGVALKDETGVTGE